MPVVAGDDHGHVAERRSELAGITCDGGSDQVNGETQVLQGAGQQAVDLVADTSTLVAEDLSRDRERVDVDDLPGVDHQVLERDGCRPVPGPLVPEYLIVKVRIEDVAFGSAGSG